MALPAIADAVRRVSLEVGAWGTYDGVRWVVPVVVHLAREEGRTIVYHGTDLQTATTSAATAVLQHAPREVWLVGQHWLRERWPAGTAVARATLASAARRVDAAAFAVAERRPESGYREA